MLGGYVFPFEAFVIACVFSTMRVIGAVGYTGSADGRMAGNMISGWVAGMLTVYSYPGEREEAAFSGPSVHSSKWFEPSLFVRRLAVNVLEAFVLIAGVKAIQLQTA